MSGNSNLCVVKTSWPNSPDQTSTLSGNFDDNSKVIVVDTPGVKPHPLVSHVYAVNRKSLFSTDININVPQQKEFFPVPTNYNISGNPTGLWRPYADVVIPTISGIDYNSAENKCLAKLQGGDVNLATFFGEGHKTLQMFTSSVSRIAHAAYAARRGQFTKAFSFLGVDPTRSSLSRLRKIADTSKKGKELLANSWLEYTYGWKPLVQDLYGSVEAYQKGFVQQGHVFWTRSQVSDSKLYEFKQLAPYQSNFGPKIYFHATGSCHAVAKSGIQFRVKSSYVATLQSLGLLNPLSLAWELMPYSFVVDWFIPIGDYLAATTATAGLTFIDGWSRAEQVREVNASIYNGSFTSRFVTYNRRVFSGNPSVSPLLRVWDGLSDHVSRQASAVALLQQAFYRR